MKASLSFRTVSMMALAFLVGGCASPRHQPVTPQGPDAAPAKHAAGELVAHVVVSSVVYSVIGGSGSLGAVAGTADYAASKSDVIKGMAHGIGQSARCGPAFPVCAVLGGVVGAALGATGNYDRPFRPYNAGMPSCTRPAGFAFPFSGGPRWSLDYVGRIGELEAFPAGELFIATDSTKGLWNGRKAAWLVVNLDGQSEEGARSYGAYATVDCTTGALSVSRWAAYQSDSRTTFAANEGVISCFSVKRPQPVAGAAAAIASAGRAICSGSL